MYNELLYDLKVIEEKYSHSREDKLLFKSIHSALLNDYPKEEIIYGLINLLKDGRAYKEGWNDAVDEFKLYDRANYL